MNWKLIFALSGFGVVMGLATVFVIPPDPEPLVWLAVFAVCGAVIAKQAPGRYFLHGFAVSVVNSLWVTAAHIAFLDRFLAGHPREAAMAQNLPVPTRLAMAFTGPLVGVALGLVAGLIAWGASKVLKPATAP
jgi:hypothetical protein